MLPSPIKTIRQTLVLWIIVITINALVVYGKSCTAGDIWCSDDNCTIYECQSPTDVLVYKRACPPVTPCLSADVYTQDCCQYCRNQTITDPIQNSVESNPCKRSCVEGESMTCMYSMTIEVFQAMSDACFDCPFNVSDCYRQNCIRAEGIPRLVVVANRSMPAPAIEVCVGDVIVVDIINGLISQDTIIHWHGIPQLRTPYDDGAPFITQCPIMENNNFRYVFNADYPGTYFWHSDVGLQNQDGLLGSLIIRQPLQDDSNADMYDTDDNIMFLQHWNAYYSENQFYGHYMMAFGLVPQNILINGSGRLKGVNATFLFNATGENLEQAANMVMSTISVTQGSKNRIRIINGATSICPFSISIDNHTMIVISIDGFDIDAVEVEQLILNNQERYDVVLVANQPVANYWIRVKGLLQCEEQNQLQQLAILSYDGASAESSPAQSPDYNYPQIAGPILDTIHAPRNDDNDNIYLTDLCSKQSLQSGLDTDTPDYKFYVQIGYTLARNPMLMASKCTARQPTLRFNNITFDFPHSSLLTQPEDNVYPQCNLQMIEKGNVDCSKKLCRCLHTLRVNLDSIVEVILYTDVDDSELFGIHLHGYTFRVIGMGKGKSLTQEKLKEMDQAGEIKRNYECPVQKDTVSVITPGYTIIRFNASNPGLWLMTSTNQFNLIAGAALLFQVGDRSDLPPIPTGLTQCRDYPFYLD